MHAVAVDCLEPTSIVQSKVLDQAPTASPLYARVLAIAQSQAYALAVHSSSSDLLALAQVGSGEGEVEKLGSSVQRHVHRVDPRIGFVTAYGGSPDLAQRVLHLWGGRHCVVPPVAEPGSKLSSCRPFHHCRGAKLH